MLHFLMSWAIYEIRGLPTHILPIGRLYGYEMIVWVCPGVASGVMRLDAYAMASIMQCIITKWNDPYLVSLNPNIMYVSTCILLYENCDLSVFCRMSS